MTDTRALKSATYPPIKIALGVFIGSAAMVLMGVQPILIGLFSVHLHLDLTQSGWILAAEQFGGAAGALLGYWIATRMRWTYSIAGACVLAAAVNIATAYSGGLERLPLRGSFPALQPPSLTRWRSTFWAIPRSQIACTGS